MSDFDKLFRKKLNEEGQFPRREKNWKTLSKRLDAFHAGLEQQGATVQTHLRYWQVAAAFAVLTAGWLTWKVVATQSENAQLRREVAVWKEKNETRQAEAHQADTNLKNEETQNIDIGKSKRQKTGLSSEITPRLQPATPATRTQTSHYATTGSRPAIVEAPNNSQLLVDEERTRQESIPASTDSTNARESALAPDDFEKKWPNLPFLPANALENVALQQQVKDAPAVLPLPDTVAIASTPTMIEPVRPASRFRAGVQVLAGKALPHEKGVSMITGQGVAAEFELLKNIWLTASADWLRFDVSTNKYHPRLHPNHDKNPPPPPSGPPSKLVKVEGNQRQQHYGLGLRYALPTRFWLRPSVRVAYTWVNVSSDLLSFKYQKKFPGPPPNQEHPKYIVAKCDPEQIGNVWRLGAGLEYEAPRWVFGLWADYSDNFKAADTSFDLLQFRAGIQYRFN